MLSLFSLIYVIILLQARCLYGICNTLIVIWGKDPAIDATVNILRVSPSPSPDTPVINPLTRSITALHSLLP